MGLKKLDIIVYADWLGIDTPKEIGVLTAHYGKGRKSFSFEYDSNWLKSKEQFLLDPEINWYSGPQYSRDENFGIFLDSMPDTWGRTLMKRRVAQQVRKEGNTTRTLYDIDFLLGVFDESRMGALRFKLDREGTFLDNDKDYATPPWSSIRELQHAAQVIENNQNPEEVKKWLAILIAPGSSLGGARPKANILDDKKHPWIAKFPSKNDTIDKAKWEYLAYQLALKAGIEMSESNIEKVSGNYHTFFTKRFDRSNSKRIHFASAMTMTGNNEDTIKDNFPSYLDIAEFIQYNGANIKDDLYQLWKRIAFNIAISNTDDHLRNHGFLLKDKGWVLSPAYDINPSIDKDGLALNIDSDDNALNFELLISVGEYFQLQENEMQGILKKVSDVVKNWKGQADKIGIPRSEQELMEHGFRWYL